MKKKKKQLYLSFSNREKKFANSSGYLVEKYLPEAYQRTNNKLTTALELLLKRVDNTANC